MTGNKILQLIYRACFLLLIPGVQIFYFFLNTYRNNVKSIPTVIDNLIPFCKYFIVPYVYWYAFVFFTLVFFMFVDCKIYYRLLVSIISGTLICFLVYYFFPTTVARPEVVGNDIFSNMIRTLYSKDNPYNCFPSIHVLDAVLPTMFLFKYTKNKFTRAFAIVSSAAIILSTLFIKQHYLWDAVSAAVLGTAMYLLYTNDYLWSSLPVRRVSAFFRLVKIKSLARDRGI